jgi:hypothetical protein
MDAKSSIRLSSSALEMTRPLGDPHRGHMFSDGVSLRRVAFWQSGHSKNVVSRLRAMRLPSSITFLFIPLR